jgi:hypothetical protein
MCPQAALHLKVGPQRYLELHMGGQVEEQALAEPQAHERQSLDKGHYSTNGLDRTLRELKSRQVVGKEWMDGWNEGTYLDPYIYPQTSPQILSMSVIPLQTSQAHCCSILAFRSQDKICA